MANSNPSITAGNSKTPVKQKKSKIPIIGPAEKQYANGRLLRSTIADKEKAVRFHVEEETKARKAARERGEAQKASENAATKLDKRQIPIDAPGQPISATQKQYNLRNRALPHHDPSRYVFNGPPNRSLPPLEPSTPRPGSPNPSEYVGTPSSINPASPSIPHSEQPPTLGSTNPPLTPQPQPASPNLPTPRPKQSSTNTQPPVSQHSCISGELADENENEDDDEDDDESNHRTVDDNSSVHQADEGDDEPETIDTLRPPPGRNSRRAPIRIQMFDFDAYKNDPWLSEHVTAYVNTDRLISDTRGNVSCHLSDILPKAAQFNSPLKDRNYKIWRLDSRKQPVSLGRGDTASSSVAEQHILDIHRLQLHEASDDDGAEYYSGIKLLIEDKSKSATRRQAIQFFSQSPLKSQPRAKSPASPSPVKAKEATKQKSKSTGMGMTKQRHSKGDDGSSDDNSEDEPSAVSDLDEAKIGWLRTYFKLPTNDNRLPGRRQVVKARDHLERWKAITHAKETWEREWQKLVPDDVKVIGGQPLKLEHLQAAFGFRHSNWHNCMRMFEPTKSPLRNARNVLAWMENPDATTHASLNLLNITRLRNIIHEDSRGRYRSGEPSKPSHPAAEHRHHNKDGKKRKYSPSRSRSRSRSRSPQRQRYHSPSRSPSPHGQAIDSDNMDQSSDYQRHERYNGSRHNRR
ncbi:hypothetical protein FRC03_002254 [Tulasnella sp. 419]|nr:hypothetical protein FRC02_001250 [Tulasnella sp. 418]KAG8943951.1 hypothetical protein FRC03_002254 [Tulasnella sp. 419]